MKKGEFPKLTIEAFEEEIQQGGWFISSGTEYKAQGFQRELVSVEGVHYKDNVLEIFSGEKCFKVQEPRIYLLSLWMIQVHCTFLERQQIKKTGGELWREVPKERVALRIVNPNIRKNESEQKSEQVREESNQVEVDKSRLQFVLNFVQDLLTKDVVNFAVREDQVILKFADNTLLRIDLGDDYV